MLWTRKSDYGKVPDYLTRIKDQINKEYEEIRQHHLQEEKTQEQQM